MWWSATSHSFPVRLVVFPEFAQAAPIYETVGKAPAQKLALPLPNEFTRLYEAKAKKYGIYIPTGTFLEVDEAARPGSCGSTRRA